MKRVLTYGTFDLLHHGHIRIVESVRYVDLVIPETSWDQKLDDVKRYDIDVVVMGDDWADSDRFDYLKEYCELVFLPRTEGVSTTDIKAILGKSE